jgi:hydrogenase maturation factor HypF (carbamoyltransferase family)
VAQALGALVKQLALPGSVCVGVAGGVFQNTLLLDLIAAHGQPVRVARRQPTNDGGLALGQIIEISALTPSCE